VGKTWADKLIFLGAILGAMSIYLFSKGPAVSEKHRLFRLAVPLVGLILALIGGALKLASRPKE
jgi:hypothetical protein